MKPDGDEHKTLADAESGIVPPKEMLTATAAEDATRATNGGTVWRLPT
jgi:hypothetical protein